MSERLPKTLRPASSKARYANEGGRGANWGSDPVNRQGGDGSTSPNSDPNYNREMPTFTDDTWIRRAQREGDPRGSRRVRDRDNDGY